MSFFKIDKLHRKTSDDSSVFKAYRTIGRYEYSRIVSFCQRYQVCIAKCNFDEFFIIQLAFCNALFQTNRFNRHIEVADLILQLSISHNIQYYNGEDIYLKTLFQKAQAHQMIGEGSEAIRITKKLLLIKQKHKQYQAFLKYCYLKNKYPFLVNLQKYSVFILLITIITYLLNYLFLQHYFSELFPLIHTITVNSFLLNIVIFFSSWSLRHWLCNRELTTVMRQIINQVSNSSSKL